MSTNKIEQAEEPQTLTDIVNEAEENRSGNGLFSRVRRSLSRRKKSISPPSSPSPGRLMRKKSFKKKTGSSEHGQNNDISTPSPKKSGFTFGRRIVKATHPPPLDELNTDTTTSSTTTSSSTKEEDSLKDLEEKHIDRVSSPIPSIQDEALRDKTEQFRKERLEKVSQVRKEKKEEFIDNRRKHEHENPKREVDTIPSTTNTSTTSTTNISDVFSVEPKFPEHKRKHPIDENPGKKIKVSTTEDEDEKKHIEHAEKEEVVESVQEDADIEDNTPVCYSGNRLSRSLPIVAAAIAVAAVFAMNRYKRR